jgi:hypothetical protein
VPQEAVAFKEREHAVDGRVRRRVVERGAHVGDAGAAKAVDGFEDLPSPAS